MTATSISKIEDGLLNRMVKPKAGTMPRELAESILAITLSPKDEKRLHVLAEKNRRDELTVKERDELNMVLRVGRVIDLLKAKALKTVAGAKRAKR